MKTDIFDQYARLKSQQPGAILLLRVGDFYEAVDDDAVTIARVLGLALTSRGDRRMAGFPVHAIDRYSMALVRAGFRVAMGEYSPAPTPNAPASGGFLSRDDAVLREAAERGHRDGFLEYVNCNPYPFRSEEWDAYQTAWDQGQRDRAD